MDYKNYADNIVSHYEKVWGKEYNVFLHTDGPFNMLSPLFRVFEFKPFKDREMWTYATVNMSSYDNDAPIELHIFSDKQDRELVELLTIIAYYHQNTNLLGIHHTVNFGKPWRRNSNCTYGFISLPYMDGPELEILKYKDKIVKFYWLIPITQQEVDYKIKYGVEALEEKFEEKGLDYLNSNRKSIV